MKHRILLCCAVLVTIPAWAHDEPTAELLGRCTADQLEREPYADWFREGYDGYEPNRAILESLRRLGHEGVELTLFFGTWCGDSRREVPRMLKLLDEIDFSSERLRLIAVDNGEDALKRSPGGEEQGLEIWRVPTLVVVRRGREVSRIVEHPVLSLERDLLAILRGEDYRPSYRAYPVVRRWLAEGLLADDNVSPSGLAGEVRALVANEWELRAVARVLLSRGDVDEAVKLFETNRALYRRSSRCHADLAGALIRAGDPDEARRAAERAIRLNTEPEETESLIELLGRTLR